ncbi:hypothetical protein HYFRA_00012532 [Hymenoscyphus fraxineus]|uniref:Uncharacterized protein n=1 Tax=Hymenoscyphus fraxineus TaxID=746836 RepID=A0A9N9PV99_9HELO|nr:hypothetical protein HYFRA_00012532 [Hymenoscyphus fraxineus]
MIIALGFGVFDWSSLKIAIRGGGGSSLAEVASTGFGKSGSMDPSDSHSTLELGLRLVLGCVDNGFHNGDIWKLHNMAMPLFTWKCRRPEDMAKVACVDSFDLAYASWTLGSKSRSWTCV